MGILKKIAEKRLRKEVDKTCNFEAQKDKVVECIAGAFNVFRKPNFRVYTFEYELCDDYVPEFITIFGKKLFRKPDFLIKHEWEYKPLKYDYVFGEFRIQQYPSAKCIMYGKKIEIELFECPTNTSCQKYYFESILEYLHGHGAHKGNLRLTIEKLGRASMGVQFNDYDPHVFSVMGDDRMELPEFGNSMYYVLDKSYLRPERYQEYDLAVDILKRNESPMMI